MIEAHGATVLLMWATGGLAFTWVTTRRREVGIGYGWTMRLTYLAVAVGAAVTGFTAGTHWPREAASLAVIGATVSSLAVSIRRRKAGVRHQRLETERRSARVAAMTGIDAEVKKFDPAVGEFPPSLDIVAPTLGTIGLIAAAVHAGGPTWLAIVRIFAGAGFLGAITDAMLLGHWYLVQPGLPRAPVIELVRASGILWLPHAVAFMIPTGMWAVLDGSIDDGYGGMLGWFWLASTVATGVLLALTRLVLRERQYAAVMAGTGLLYLAILTAFGQDLVARVLLDA